MTADKHSVHPELAFETSDVDGTRARQGAWIVMTKLVLPLCELATGGVLAVSAFLTQVSFPVVALISALTAIGLIVSAATELASVCTRALRRIESLRLEPGSDHMTIGGP